MAVIKGKPSKLGSHALCPGCGHGIIIRLIQEIMDELGVADNQIVVMGVGCVCTGTPAFPIDRFQAAHGRGAATATAIKRVLPETVVYSYQGDGDAYVIGLAETMNAAYRNENIVQVVVNNNNFGMTGGQMSWTTMPGQKTETSQSGRDCDLNGLPFHYPEMVANSKGFRIAYAARGAVYSPATIAKTKKMLKNAFEAQLAGEGYSIVEVLSACPTNWHMTPLQCTERISTIVEPEYPLGEFKTRG